MIQVRSNTTDAHRGWSSVPNEKVQNEMHESRNGGEVLIAVGTVEGVQLHVVVVKRLAFLLEHVVVEDVTGQGIVDDTRNGRVFLDI